MTDDEFVFRPVEVHELTREDERDVISSLTPPVCDFCTDARVRWDYDCADFELTEFEWGSLNGFTACERCSELIEAEDWHRLAVRVALAYARSGNETTDDYLRFVAAMIKAFRKNYVPGRKAFG